MLAALGGKVSQDDFANMSELEKLTGTKAPVQLTGLRDKQIRFTQTIVPAQIGKAAKKL